VIVDYLQLMLPDFRVRGGDRVEAITYISQGLKRSAKVNDVHIMALSQLSRAVEQREDKRPHLSDLRDSGSIEQDADNVLFLFRPEYYLKATEPPFGDDKRARNTKSCWRRAKTRSNSSARSGAWAKPGRRSANSTARSKRSGRRRNEAAGD
jgi:replicative DNA helicase